LLAPRNPYDEINEVSINQRSCVSARKD
jgi:hypothetical protein